MSTRKETLIFGENLAELSMVKKTALRIINILTRKISICFKKNTQISKVLIICPTKNKYVINI